MPKISVVINTINEEHDIERAIKSLKWADEAVVCDMHSTDKTVEIAKKYGAKIVLHDKKDYVELVRNFTISQASNEWILILDADEEIPETLATKLKELTSNEDNLSFVEIPRKNIIFGKWVKESMWWPDYNIRFFKKGNVSWSGEIHRPPKTSGSGLKLPLEEKYAITHYHYTSISQFLQRMDRYTNAQAEEIKNNGYRFKWMDLIDKPLNEFLGRYFANYGFKDGLHGLALSLLQAFSFLIMYLKLWELEKFENQEFRLNELGVLGNKKGKEINYWFKYVNLSPQPFKRLLQRVKNKIS